MFNGEKDFCSKAHSTEVNKTYRKKTVFNWEDANIQNLITDLQFNTGNQQ